MTASPYQGVILAAGHGSRMGPFGEQVPKPIAPICNKPLLGYQLEHMRALGVEEVIVVIGHLGHRISQALGDGAAYGLRIRYVEQRQRLGLAHAVGQLEGVIDRPFLLFLGDIFFEMRRLRDMVECFEQHQPGAVLAVMDEPNHDAIKKNFSVHLAEDGRVRRVIEKPRHVTGNLKGCGLYLFDLPIFDAIRRTPRTAMRDEYELTESIQILIDMDYRVRVAPVVDWDMNLTYIGDLIHCCVHELGKRGVRSLVGPECTLAEGVELRDSVLGAGVCIPRPLRLERCVVMEGVTLDRAEPLCDAVVTHEGILHAKG